MPSKIRIMIISMVQKGDALEVEIVDIPDIWLYGDVLIFRDFLTHIEIALY